MRLVIVIFAGLALLVSATSAAQQSAAGGRVEVIYVARSLRLSRVAPSEYCAAARTGFPGSTFEDRYDFKAVASRAADGLVTNTAGPTVGHLRACFGATSDPLVVNFYAEGDDEHDHLASRVGSGLRSGWVHTTLHRDGSSLEEAIGTRMPNSR